MAIGKITGRAEIRFSREAIMRMINRHYLGRENCNEMNEENILVPIEHPDMNKVIKAHKNIRCTHYLDVEATLDEDGSIKRMKLSNQERGWCLKRKMTPSYAEKEEQSTKNSARH